MDNISGVVFLVELEDGLSDLDAVRLESETVVPERIAHLDLDGVAVVFLNLSVVLGDVTAFEVVRLPAFELLRVLEVKAAAGDAANVLFFQEVS